MKVKFPSVEKYIQEDDVVVGSNKQSKEYINIPELMSKHGNGLVSTLKMRAPVIPKMAGCMKESLKSASSVVNNPRAGKTIISKEELSELETYIKSMEIDKIGYTKVSADLVFSNHQILYGHAIVIIMEMKKEEMATAPSKDALKEVFRTYYNLGVTVNKIAEYLRAHGFNAMAGPAIGGDANYVPIAEKAGLGVIGKHGLLITKDHFGPSLRIATIYTDIQNLPFSTQNEHMWIKDFCEKCKKCVKACPGQAIYEQTLEAGRAIDQDKCAKPFANEYGCSVCIKECTFFSNDYETIKKSFNKKTIG